MFVAEPMSELNVVFLERDEIQILKATTDSGAVHIVQPQVLHPWTSVMTSENLTATEKQYGMVATRTRLLLQELEKFENIVSRAGAATPQSPEDLQMDFTELSTAAKKIQARVEGLEAERKQLEILTRQDYSPHSADLAGHIGGPHSFLRVEFVKGDEKNLPTLQARLVEVPSVVITISRREEGRTIPVTLMVVVLRRDRVVLQKALEAAGFEPEDKSLIEPQGEMGLEKIKDRKKEVEKELKAERQFLSEWSDKNAPELIDVYYTARRGQLAAKAKTFVRCTRHARFFCGWIPTAKGKDLLSQLSNVTGGKCFAELIPADELEGVREGSVQVPALFHNPKWMRPFEGLTSGFGTPRYESINPTPFLSVTFLFMFGMMFGDIGHGAILAIVGAILARKISSHSLGKILFLAGCSSVVFGALYGSIFGLEGVIHHLWLAPMEQIETLSLVAIVYGVLMISLGIILRVINAYRERDWVELFFDKAGLIGGAFYWIILGLACRSIVVSGSSVPKFVLFIICGLAAAIVLKGPILKVLRIHHHEESGGMFSQIFDGAFELYEMAIGMLSNTISFVRLAAFALGHVGVSVGVYSLMDVVPMGVVGIIWRILLVVLGNAGIILLEGLVVGIQTVRLEYFEFFCKFFRTGGLEYKPLNLEET